MYENQWKHLCWKMFFVVIVIVFRIMSTFYLINVSLLNKSINFFNTKNILLNPDFWAVVYIFRTTFCNLGINEESIFIWPKLRSPKLSIVESTIVVFTALIFG